MRLGRVGIRIVATLACATACAAGAAGGATGRLLAGCLTCHGGIAGEGASLPALQGLAAPAISSALRDFRDGRRAGTVMPQLAKGYADADIDAAAAYLSALPRP